MSKVIYEFNENEESRDIDLINARYKMVHALNELQDFRRTLYKGWLNEEDMINVKDTKVLTKEDYDKLHEEGKLYFEGTKRYISYDYVEQKIDYILNDISFLID